MIEPVEYDDDAGSCFATLDRRFIGGNERALTITRYVKQLNLPTP